MFVDGFVPRNSREIAHWMFDPKFSAFWMRPWDSADARRNFRHNAAAGEPARTRLDGRGHDHRHAGGSPWFRRRGRRNRWKDVCDRREPCYLRIRQDEWLSSRASRASADTWLFLSVNGIGPRLGGIECESRKSGMKAAAREHLRPFCLRGACGPLLAIYYAPAAEASPSGDMLFVPPFAEEMNRCRAMVALQARALSRSASERWCSIPTARATAPAIFPRPRGNRGATISSAASSGCAATRNGCHVLWGVRLGAVMAADLAAQDSGIGDCFSGNRSPGQEPLHPVSAHQDRRRDAEPRRYQDHR